MLTESEARDLLTKAANTVEVTPGTPIEKAPRTLWPMLAAAAAVIAVVGTTAAVVGNTSDDAGLPAVDPTTATTSPKPVLAPDQIPSVFAYDADSATRLLQSSGLEVTRKPDYRCGTPGRATKTDPAVGARFQPGDAVTLHVTQIPPNARCVEPANEDAAWRFLDFANGRGPAPAFADEVNLYVNGVSKTLTGAEAADPGSWGSGSALDALAVASREVSGQLSDYTTPFLRFGGGPNGSENAVDRFCGQLPPELQSRPAVWLGVNFPMDGIDICTFEVGIFQTDGRIDSIVSRTQPPVEAEVIDPDGIGASFLAFARGEADTVPVAEQVRLYLGNKLLKTISSADANNPAAWDLCAQYAGRSCPMSAVRTMLDYAGPVAYTDFLPDGCKEALAADVGGSTPFVTISIPEPRTCGESFAIQIWYANNHISAVNLILDNP